MGFFENLFKSQVKKVVSNAVDNAVDNWIGNSNQANVSSNPVVSNPDEDDCCNSEAVVRSRVERIVAEEWPGYELRKNIPASELGAPFDARNYTYGLYLNGIPKATIIIIDNPNHYCKKDVRLAHEACERQGIFCMNLLLHLPNRRSYISERLRTNVPNC